VFDREVAVAESPSKKTCHTLSCTPSSPPNLEFAVFDREVAVAESASKKNRHALSSTPSSAPGPHVWADFLDSLLECSQNSFDIRSSSRRFLVECKSLRFNRFARSILEKNDF
jgi:hypothetical protein